MSAPSAPLDLRVAPGAVDGVAARCVHGLLVCGAATSLAAVALAMVLAGLILESWSGSLQPPKPPIEYGPSGGGQRMPG